MDFFLFIIIIVVSFFKFFKYILLRGKKMENLNREGRFFFFLFLSKVLQLSIHSTDIGESVTMIWEYYENNTRLGRIPSRRVQHILNILTYLCVFYLSHFYLFLSLFTPIVHIIFCSFFLPSPFSFNLVCCSILFN